MLNYGWREIYTRATLIPVRVTLAPAVPRMNPQPVGLPATPTTGASPNVAPAPAKSLTAETSWLWLGGAAAGLGFLWWLIDG